MASPAPKRLSSWTFPAERSLMWFQICVLGWRVAWSHTAGGFYFSSDYPVKMSCLHPPRPHQSSLTTRPAFVNVLLLCNFTSKLKIDRRLGQTVFGLRKQQNSYKMCLWLHRTFEGKDMFPWEMTTSETLQPFPEQLQGLGFEHRVLQRFHLAVPTKQEVWITKNKFVWRSSWILSAHQAWLCDFTSKDA